MQPPFRIEQASGVIDGVNTTFTTSGAYVSTTLQVWRNGQLNRSSDPSEGWVENGSMQFTMNIPPLLGDVLQAGYRPL